MLSINTLQAISNQYDHQASFFSRTPPLIAYIKTVLEQKIKKQKLTLSGTPPLEELTQPEMKQLLSLLLTEYTKKETPDFFSIYIFPDVTASKKIFDDLDHLKVNPKDKNSPSFLAGLFQGNNLDEFAKFLVANSPTAAALQDKFAMLKTHELFQYHNMHQMLTSGPSGYVAFSLMNKIFAAFTPTSTVTLEQKKTLFNLYVTNNLLLPRAIEDVITNLNQKAMINKNTVEVILHAASQHGNHPDTFNFIIKKLNLCTNETMQKNLLMVVSYLDKSGKLSIPNLQKAESLLAQPVEIKKTELDEITFDVISKSNDARATSSTANWDNKHKPAAPTPLTSGAAPPLPLNQK